MKTPDFWYKDGSLPAKLLSPLGGLYHVGATILSFCGRTYRASVPVLCVGNVTVGGSGKTPTTITLVKILHEMGYTPHIISRGYKAAIPRTHRVLPTDSAEQVGDEALLLVKAAPTWIGPDRVPSCKSAIEQGADVLILDDGLQSNRIHKDLTFLVLDGHQSLGNEKIFPAGPLRMPWKKGLKEADGIVVIHKNEKVKKLLKSALESAKEKPIFCGNFYTKLPIPPQKIIAFAGIGYPEKFKIYLESLKFEVIKFFPFPDHYAYTKKDIDRLTAAQKKYGVALLTTEKDAVKLPTIPHLYTLPISLVFEKEEALKTFLRESLEKCIHGKGSIS